MSSLFAETALLPGGWASDVRIETSGGRIAGIAAGAVAKPGDERCAILIPGMPNLHSHAFQRGMAGLAETRGPGADSFWSWREVMYRFALSMTPDHVEAVAAQLYAEMLEAGFSRVGEFHYLHHDVDGRPYADIAEMAVRIAAAATRTGIGLTLLPVFYAHSGFGGQAPTEGQRRFINDLNGFARLIESSRKAVESIPEAVVGVAPHSLRAVTPKELAAVTAIAPRWPDPHPCRRADARGRGLHRMVGRAARSNGCSPMLTSTQRWCLIHATHMTEAETKDMAKAGAIAGLCPITEANLGDGTFPGRRFTAKGGRFGIGSDSNVLIGVADELRQLEYSQRLARQARNVLARPGQSNGRALFDAAVTGGGVALGADGGGLAAGAPADFVSLDPSHPSLAGKKGDAILDAWIFANGAKVDCVWVHGKKLVEGGRHVRGDAIAKRFRKAMMELTA